MPPWLRPMVIRIFNKTCTSKESTTFAVPATRISTACAIAAGQRDGRAIRWELPSAAPIMPTWITGPGYRTKLPRRNIHQEIPMIFTGPGFSVCHAIAHTPVHIKTPCAGIIAKNHMAVWSVILFRSGFSYIDLPDCRFRLSPPCLAINIDPAGLIS